MKKKKNNLEKIILGKKKDKKREKNFYIKFFIYSFFWLGLLFTLFFSSSIESILNKTEFDFSSAILSGSYRVHFIDVGQGDCILVELPDDKTLVIDSGPSSSENEVMEYINALKISTIDYFILTHTDSDHIGNAVAIFENLDVINVFVPKIYSSYEVEQGLNSETFNVVTTDIWSNVTQAIYNETCLENKTYNFTEETIFGENYSFVFYSPFEDVISNVNNYSPIIMANIEGTKFIFTGDATSSVENNFLSNYSQLVESDFFDCDVLKVGHHGSATSTTVPFLQAISAEYAVISVGIDNSYSHPRDEVLNNLFDAGCEVLRTDTMGSVVMTTSEGNVISQTGYNNLSRFIVQWDIFVLGGGIILVCLAFVFFKIKVKKM
ncbi:MAG: MBL fold metallo-hydrolase [Clostridia bacterium]|nr:MBL fold metallo-hydrolase [Clostridia bacterium]